MEKLPAIGSVEFRVDMLPAKLDEVVDWINQHECELGNMNSNYEPLSQCCRSSVAYITGEDFYVCLTCRKRCNAN